MQNSYLELQHFHMDYVAIHFCSNLPGHVSVDIIWIWKIGGIQNQSVAGLAVQQEANITFIFKKVDFSCSFEILRFSAIC